MLIMFSTFRIYLKHWDSFDLSCYSFFYKCKILNTHSMWRTSDPVDYLNKPESVLPVNAFTQVFVFVAKWFLSRRRQEKYLIISIYNLVLWYHLSLKNRDVTTSKSTLPEDVNMSLSCQFLKKLSPTFFSM